MQQVVDFILELDKLKAVTRKTKPLGQERYENSAEHSWQIAVLAMSMAPFAEKPIDVNRVIRMLLVHDIGEIDTGDTFFYLEHGWAERKVAEKETVTRVFGLLPEPERSAFMELWQEFEDAVTPEAKFAHAADRAMPVLLNLANNGQSWKENGVTHDQVVQRVGPAVSAGCPALWALLQVKLEEEANRGWFSTTEAPRELRKL